MQTAGNIATVLRMPDLATVSLRARTRDDLDVLFSLAADLDTWEERSPWAPAALTREQHDAQLARAAETDEPEDRVNFVIDVDGTAVGTATLFGMVRSPAMPRPGSTWCPRPAAAGSGP